MLIWGFHYLNAMLTSVNIISYHDQLIKKYINLLCALKQQLRKHWVIMICLAAKKKSKAPNKNRFWGILLVTGFWSGFLGRLGTPPEDLSLRRRNGL